MLTPEYSLWVAALEAVHTGVRAIHKFGALSGLTSSLTPVTSSGTYQTPTSEQSLEILSDDADDAAAGDGARSVEVIGLNGWATQTEVIALDGTTPVVLTKTFSRVYRMKVATSGTYADGTSPSHNSTITLRAEGGGATWALIEPEGGFGLGQSEIGVYSVGAGEIAYLVDYSLDSEGNKPSKFLFYVREEADTVVAPFSPMQVKILHRTVDGHLAGNLTVPLGPFVGPCDLGWMASSPSGTPDVDVDFVILTHDADL